MSNEELTHTLTQAVAELSEASALKELFHRHKDGNPLPSGQVLEEIVQLLRTILFPGYYGQSSVNTRSIEYHIGVHVERLHQLLSDQILAGLCFTHCDEDDTAPPLEERRSESERMAAELIARLPQIRCVLATDVTAAYNGDPAAESYGEIISCYPVIKALVNYRVAHELLKMGVPLIPRILTEMAHSETGIDIHPAASIGEYFTIDHGTGVVVGATCIIGRNVKLYQGVTLGARSFPLDEDGHPIRDILRHPVLEDNVIVYSNATILGRVTIGEGCVVGANIWVTEDMAPNTKIYKKTK
jgi:serine O-acetyltransferase